MWRHDHIALYLSPVRLRVIFSICVPVWKCSNTVAAAYTGDLYLVQAENVREVVHGCDLYRLNVSISVNQTADVHGLAAFGILHYGSTVWDSLPRRTHSNWRWKLVCYNDEHHRAPNGDAKNFHLGGYSRGRRSPVGRLGLKQFGDIVIRFWMQKRSKFENFLTLHDLILDQSVSQWGLSDIWGLSPL